MTIGAGISAVKGAQVFVNDGAHLVDVWPFVQRYQVGVYVTGRLMAESPLLALPLSDYRGRLCWTFGVTVAVVQGDDVEVRLRDAAGVGYDLAKDGAGLGIATALLLESAAPADNGADCD